MNPSANELTAIGETLRVLREAKGWSVVELAERAGLDAEVISGIESASVESDLLQMAVLSKTLGLNLSDFFKQAGL